MTSQTSPFGPQRRILTSHAPNTPAGQSEPNVVTHDLSVQGRPVVLPTSKDGKADAYIASIWATTSNPAVSAFTLDPSNPDEDTATQVKGLVHPDGSHCQVTDLEPFTEVGMHRTSSVDYNIFVKGSATLITPTGPNGEVQETEVNVGDVVVQRGTLHAWKVGKDGARWITVLVAAEPVKDGNGKALEDVDIL
jgi:hypothetical protein